MTKYKCVFYETSIKKIEFLKTKQGFNRQIGNPKTPRKDPEYRRQQNKRPQQTLQNFSKPPPE